MGSNQQNDGAGASEQRIREMSPWMNVESVERHCTRCHGRQWRIDAESNHAWCRFGGRRGRADRPTDVSSARVCGRFVRLRRSVG